MRPSGDAEPGPPGSGDPREDVEELLSAAHRGDDAAFNRLFSLLYEDLRRLARRYLRTEREGHTLSTTALVHEAYLKLARQPGRECRNRAQFLAFTSRAMRQILVDYARHRGAGKRGGDQIQVTLQPDMGASGEEETFDLLALEQALDQLAERDPRLRVVVECRFFGGMPPEEIAAALGVTRRTVDRDWVRARTYLYHLLHPRAAEH